MRLFQGIPQAPEDRSRWYWFCRAPLVRSPISNLNSSRAEVDTWAKHWEPRIGYLTGVGGLLIPRVTYGEIASDASNAYWFAIGPIEPDDVPQDVRSSVGAYLEQLPEDRL